MSRKRKTGQKGRNLGIFPAKIFKNRLVVTVLLCAIIMGGIFYGLWHFFFNSKFFAIKEIVVNKEGNYSFWTDESRLRDLFIGRNIFTVDLENMETFIRESSPQLERVEVRRIPPDRLEIDVVPREPVAFIGSRGGLVIDKEAVVLAKGRVPGNLVEIKGIRFFFTTPSRGERVENEMLEKALMLLGGLRERRLTGQYGVEYIDISDKNNIQLGIRGIKVKMGSDDFSRKINKLKEILEDPDVKPGRIDYIDLRFDTAVISPK